MSKVNNNNYSVSKSAKSTLITFWIIVILLITSGLIGCTEPKQNTKAGEFGHFIYKRQTNNVVNYHIVGMYLNDSLIVMGNPLFIGEYPIFNVNRGEIVGTYKNNR